MIAQLLIALIKETWEKNGDQVVKLLLDYLSRRLTPGAKDVDFDSTKLPPELVAEVEGILNPSKTPAPAPVTPSKEEKPDD